MMPRSLGLLITGVLGFALHAFPLLGQQFKPAPSATIYGEMQRLRSLCHVMYVAAHPDDENTRLLAWLVNGRHIRTSYLSLTRGDGGQNILGSEQGSALGLIRTHELLEARKLDGAGQFFSRAIDFGFSKNPEETFKHWNEEELVRDVVWMYRTQRPDVVICRFPKDSMAGHGQHSASAIIAEKAYALAGDPKVFPEQLTKTSVWLPKRLLFNSFRFGNRSTVREGQFRLDVGQYDPLIGMGYGELAGISRSIHRSQGAGTPSVPGVQSEYFALLAGDTLRTSLFDGVDTTWSRVGRTDIGVAVDAMIAAYSMLHPEKSLPALLAIRTSITAVKDDYWRTQKLAEIDAIILHCSGIMAEAVTAGKPLALAGERIPATVRVTARAGSPLQLKSITWPDGSVQAGKTLEQDSLTVLEQEITIPQATAVTEPYWLQKDNDGALFTIPSSDVLGLPVTPVSLPVKLELQIGAATVAFTVPLSYKKLDPLKGDVVEMLRIVPPVSVDPETPVALAAAGAPAVVPVRIRAYTQVTNATLRYQDASGSIGSVENISIKANTDSLLQVSIPASARTGDYDVTFELVTANGTYGRSVKTIQYDHLPTLQYTRPARVRVVRADWTVTAKKVAFINGAGDYMPEFLRLAGIQVDEIEDADILKTEQLLKYDAVVTGIRMVNTRKSTQYLMPALLRYVESGGVLVMQYNTLQDMATKDLGPFPFTLTAKRVTEEDAAVRILKPDHALLNKPNKISATDYTGWVQERGLYFADAIDPRYTTLFSMNDTREQPLDGSLLYAPYGKGHYVYCSLSLFRQLPAGVKGPMRLLMNMLSLGE